MRRFPDGQGPPPRVALLHDRLDWHSRQLIAAFAALGAAALPARLAACGFDSGAPGGVRIEGFDALPDLALVRLVAGGSFEAVTVRLGVLHALAALGVPVVNAPQAVERCTDKSMTSFLLHRAGLATPQSWCVQSQAAAQEIAARECGAGPLVLKPLFGSQGRGLRLVGVPEDLPEPETVAGVYYLQRFIGVERAGYCDIRALVSRGRVLAAMLRRAPHWITNIKQGAAPHPLTLDAAAADLAVRAAASVGADIAGVDIALDAAGAPQVLEVNSMPGWSGLQTVTPFNIAAALAQDVLALAGARHG